MRRPVIVWVDDGTEQLSVWHWAGTDAHGPLHVEQVPVPPDDQLLRDIHFALRVLDEYESEARHDEAVHAQAGNTAREREWRAAANGAEDAAARLRAAFQLDQEDE